MRDPLLVPLAAFAGGIVVSRFAPFEPAETALPLAGFLLLALAGWLGGTKRGMLAALLPAVGLLGVRTAETHRRGPPPEIEALPREVLLLEGCVVEPPVFHEDRLQFLLELEPGARVRVSLAPAEGSEQLAYGRRVAVEARVRKPRNFGNPGSFDYEGYLARRQIYWTAAVPAGAGPRLLPGQCGSRFRSALFAIRTAALDRIDRLYPGDGWAAGMMRAILIGDSSALDPLWTAPFRETGTFHALVISGLHVAVLAGSLFFLLRLAAVGEIPALAVTAAAAWLYALVSGWQPPVARSACGFTLYLAARFFFRRGRLLNLLAAVALAFLAADPEQLFEASFQLSFLAVAAIGALAVPLLEATSAPLRRGAAGLSVRDKDVHLEPRAAAFRVELRLLAETVCLATRAPERMVLAFLEAALRPVFYVWEITLVSTVIQAGLALPMSAYFHRISLTGITANAAGVPLTSALVPAGFLAVAGDSTLAAGLARLLLRAATAVSEWHARLEPGWRMPAPPAWLGLCFSALLILAASAPRFRGVWAASAMAAFAVIWIHPFPPVVEPGALELSAIDVGQGDSMLAAFPDGSLMLIDAGGFPAHGRRVKPRLDPGEDIVSPYLWSRSIRRLDVVVSTHGHEDHVGGMAAVMRNFRPREIWTGIVSSDPAWAELGEQARRQDIRLVRLAAGQSFAFGGARVEVLWPPAGGTAELRPATNRDSLVIRLVHGARSFLLAGDIDSEVEAVMKAPRADVLKVAHHGSRTSSSGEFLDAVRPIFAIVSAGFENPFGNPHPSTLNRLAERRAGILRTDQRGLIRVATNGRKLWLHPPPSP